MWALAGIGSQLLGVLAWSAARSGRSPVPLFWIGLALLTASVAIFVHTLGTGLGLSWALLTVSAAAYLIFVPRLLRAPRIGKIAFRSRVNRTKAGRGGGLGLGMRLLSAGPLYLVAAMAISCVVATKLPWDEVNRLMLGGLLVPALWALGALHATADLMLWRVLGAPVILTVLFAALYFLL